MQITSSAFGNGQSIPQKYAADGDNQSPPLSWSGVPPGARELALICEDPDAPMDEPFVHWVLYKIPASAQGLSEGDGGGAVEGSNSKGEKAYMGPLPPEGHGKHHYHFKVFALDDEMDLSPGAGKKDLLNAIQGHVVDQGEIVGTYER